MLRGLIGAGQDQPGHGDGDVLIDDVAAPRRPARRHGGVGLIGVDEDTAGQGGAAGAGRRIVEQPLDDGAAFVEVEALQQAPQVAHHLVRERGAVVEQAAHRVLDVERLVGAAGAAIHRRRGGDGAGSGDVAGDEGQPRHPAAVVDVEVDRAGAGQGLAGAGAEVRRRRGLELVLELGDARAERSGRGPTAPPAR